MRRSDPISPSLCQFLCFYIDLTRHDCCFYKKNIYTPPSINYFCYTSSKLQFSQFFMTLFSFNLKNYLLAFLYCRSSGNRFFKYFSRHAFLKVIIPVFWLLLKLIAPDFFFYNITMMCLGKVFPFFFFSICIV